MAYTPTTWIQGVSSLGPTNLNKLEVGLVAAALVADAAIPKPVAPANSDLLYYDNATSSWKAKKITTAEIAAGAGILKSQLAALSIVNADVAVAAAIDPSKIAAGLLGSQISLSKGASPPGSPADGDFWLLPADATNGVNWLFRYNSGSASAYKWELVGGAPMYSQVLTAEGIADTAAYVNPATTGPSITVPRAGDYEIAFHFEGTSAIADCQIFGAVKLGSAATSNNEAAVTGVTPNASGRYMSAARMLVRTLAASDVVLLQYARSGATPGGPAVAVRNLHIRPIRVS